MPTSPKSIEQLLGHTKQNNTAYANSPQRKESKQFYNSCLWIKIRKAQLALEPLCRLCKHEANTVDHIEPRDKAPTKALDQSNLQSLCLACHAIKTRAENVVRVA